MFIQMVRLKILNTRTPIFPVQFLTVIETRKYEENKNALPKFVFV